MYESIPLRWKVSGFISLYIIYFMNSIIIVMKIRKYQLYKLEKKRKTVFKNNILYMLDYEKKKLYGLCIVSVYAFPSLQTTTCEACIQVYLA